jgi:hypothetical protein
VEVRVFSTAPVTPVTNEKGRPEGRPFVLDDCLDQGAAVVAGDAGAGVVAGAVVVVLAGAAVLSAGALPPHAASATAMTRATGANRNFDIGSPCDLQSGVDLGLQADVM